jgi:hypothetical protein
MSPVPYVLAMFQKDVWKMNQIDKSKIEMRVLDYQTAKKIITENHYSRTMPCCELALGFYIEQVLNCVIVFGQSATARMAKSLPSPNYWELVRLFSFDWGGKNIESYCIGKALRYIEQNYDKDVIVSFADPSQGHVGGIYQATNWLYCGVTDQTGGYTYFIDGKWQHPRSTVARYGTREHKKILEIDPTIQFKRIPRKHRYIFLFGSRAKRKQLLSRHKYPILPYPKNITPGEVSMEIRETTSFEGLVQSQQPALLEKI